jgi:hypothetical protein
MRIISLFEEPGEGRLETRTIDDQQPPADEMQGGDAMNDPTFQQGMQDGMADDDPMMDVGEPEEPVVDDDLWSAVSSDAYVTDFEHSKNTTIHPRTIAALDQRDLKTLQGRIDDIMSRREMDKGGVGLYSDTTYKYLVALKAFVQRVLDEKTD